jgi:cobyrinic acid a,c-diamide synthase
MLTTSIPRIVVSGLRGGGGKTVLALSLIASFKEKGFHVTPFKKGPDYIDSGWLAKASGTPCYNLDLFMMTQEQAVHSFINHTQNSEIAIIEGNRGLFDGVDHEGTFSTAVIAKLLSTPVIITIDCTKATSTIAAMILGCQKMDPDVSIGGVVLNRIATSRQESVIRKAINKQCDIPVLGVIPKLSKDPFPERHMGLTPYQEHKGIEESIAMVAGFGEKYLDIDGILKVAKNAGEVKTEVSKKGKRTTDNSPKIGIIRDSAFQFYYQDNLDEIKKRGAELVEVSPLKESRLPDIDALYIGGGFPETHAISLAENKEFRNALHSAVQDGLPVYAECGGLMYLGRNIVLEDHTYPMVGALPITFGLEKRPRAHGYTIVEVINENSYFPEKTVLKGHEFHYSHVIDIDMDAVKMVFNVKRGKGIIDNMDGLCYKNVLATYTHLHAIGSPEWAEGIMAAAITYKQARQS